MRSPFNPIPGSGPPVRGLFVDRWGTLLEQPDGVAESFDQVNFIPGALDALFHASQQHWHIYLVGNEDSVAFGNLPLEKWKAFETDLLEHMKAHGVPIKRSYACTDNPEGKAPHNQDSVFLLPNTGLLYHAAQTDGVKLRDSWVIGDGTLELVAGWRAGTRLAGVKTGTGLSDGPLQVEPDLMETDLVAALAHICTRPGVRV
ncbi:MAG: histidinol phosphatase-like enzyme [Gammaproteobacteria bacterium]|jgi:histidinol phosphatase-like enzyme